jgi:putative DNA primase/helicase
MRRFTDALITRRFEKWRATGGMRGFVGIGLKESTRFPQPTSPYADN